MGLFSNTISETDQLSDKNDLTNDFLLKKGEIFKSISEINLEMMKISNSQSEKLIGFYDFLANAEMDKDLKAQINIEFSGVMKNHKLSVERIDQIWELIIRYLNHLNYL